MAKLRNYLSLVKFSHTIFAMPFAMVGFTLGWRQQTTHSNAYTKYPLLFSLFLVILCMVFARNAAMSFNRYLDRSFDALNPRTAIREIPAGILSGQQVLLFTVINSILFMLTTWWINPLCLALSPIALAVILFYSYTKRFTALCHLVLGLGLSLAPVGSYLAITGTFALLPILFSLLVLFWVAGFDIIYALQDEEFDKHHQLHSIPAALGKKNALHVASFLHVLAALLVCLIGINDIFGWFFAIGSGAFIGLLIYQHSLVKPDDLSKVNIAFMTSNGIASIIFSASVIADLLIKQY